jgi:hypothetical protein
MINISYIAMNSDGSNLENPRMGRRLIQMLYVWAKSYKPGRSHGNKSLSISFSMFVSLRPSDNKIETLVFYELVVNSTEWQFKPSQGCCAPPQHQPHPNAPP